MQLLSAGKLCALTMLEVWRLIGCAAAALFGCHRSRFVVSVSTPSVCALPAPVLHEAGFVISTASTPFWASGWLPNICTDLLH